MKSTLEIHIIQTAFFSKWPVQPSSAAWYLRHPPILYHLVPPLYHPALWSSADMGEALLGMGASCEEENPDISARPETREPSSLSPSDGAQELGERLHCVQRALPSYPGHFKFYKGSCSWRRKGGKAWAKAMKFLNTPEIQIKQGLPDTATAW